MKSNHTVRAVAAIPAALGHLFVGYTMTRACRGSLIVLSLLITGLLVGCGEDEPAPPTASSPPAAEAQKPASAAVPAAPATPSTPQSQQTSQQPSAAAAPKAPPKPAAPKPAVEKKADVGVGKKGRGYGKGIVATPVASLYAMREQMVFRVQIPEALKLFKAMEGRAPKDNEEFMEKIIKANNIHLPELPTGERYWYDAKTEQLMVQQPAPE
jgi:hypothetical protein